MAAIANVANVDVVMREIFRKLSIYDLQQMKMVCKRFRDLANEITIPELVVDGPDLWVLNYIRYYNWWDTGLFADQGSFVIASNGALPTSILRKLRRLGLYYNVYLSELLNYSAHLIALRHLEIFVLEVDILSPLQHLVRLPELEVLNIYGIGMVADESFRLTFQSPKLRAICLGKFRIFRVLSSDKLF